MSSWPVIFLEANLAGGLVHSVPLFTALSLVLLKRLRQAEHSIINQKNPFFFFFWMRTDRGRNHHWGFLKMNIWTQLNTQLNVFPP